AQGHQSFCRRVYRRPDGPVVPRLR
ncbi:hypothetical protein BN1723_019947, partial [Verticillium longisporum]